MPPASLALEPAPTYPELIYWLLHHHTSHAHLIVCTDRASFLQQLQASSLGLPSNDHSAETELPAESLLTPTLLNIAASHNIKLSFITSVPALLAYLTVLPHKPRPISGSVRLVENEKEALLVLLNPLALHHDTSYWSAQVISRSIALAVETAWKLQQRLMIVECNHISSESHDLDSIGGAQDADTTMTSTAADPGASETVTGDSNSAQRTAQASPWDQHIPILSPGVRTFGTGPDRSWAQKTVRVRDVMRKWCLFGALP